MKIYRLHTEENGIWCLYSESNKFSCLNFLRHYSSDMDEDKRFDNCEPLYFYMNSSINKRKKEYNIMYYNLMFLIVDKSTKVALEYNFSDSIQFIKTINEDDSSKEYYFLNPFRSIDGLDLNKSEYSCMPKSRIPCMVNKYVFKSGIKYYPIFKLKNEGAVYDTSMYATDEFKDFIESNGITGLVFEEIFDFDKAFSSETEKTTDNITEPKCTVNKNRNSNKAYNIPIKYSDGKYLLSEIKNDQGENFVMELGNCGMLTNNKNNYIVYDLKVEDIPQNTEVIYKNSRLCSVYINSQNGKIPVYLSFEFTQENVSAELEQAIENCAGFCSYELMNSLFNAQMPLEPISLECYFDGQEMNINLQDNSCTVYDISETALNTLKCICIFAGTSYTESGISCDETEKTYEVFDRILKSVHKILSAEIPKRFSVCDDFMVCEPEMYD